MKGEPINLVEAYFSAVSLGLLTWAAWQSFTTGLMPVVWVFWLFTAPLQAGFVVFFVREYFKGWSSTLRIDPDDHVTIEKQKGEEVSA